MNYLELAKLYLPLGITFILVIFIFAKIKNEREYIFKIQKFGLELVIPIKSFFIKKLLLVIVAFLIFAIYVNYDYSSYFPNELTMEVFFDKEGIDDCLELFTDEEIEELNILKKGYEKFQNNYYEKVNDEAREILNIEFLSLNKKYVHSEGETSFIVEKGKGFQTYYIKEAEGELKHFVEIPRSKVRTFNTFFEKISSPSDKISIEFGDIFIKRNVILKPRFKQIIAENIKSEGKEFDHILCGYTIVEFFPIPKFSNTIYLLEEEGIGLIPIGYAVYR